MPVKLKCQPHSLWWCSVNLVIEYCCVFFFENIYLAGIGKKVTSPTPTPRPQTPNFLNDRSSLLKNCVFNFWRKLLWFYKIYFAAFLHRSFEVIQIWLTHQSKALIFYFGMKKILSPIFENFVGNRQTKFHILKFRVCKHTLNLNSWNLVCLFPTNFQKSDSKSFSCQNRKSELSIDGLIISGSLQSFDVRKRQNKFCKISQNCNLSALLNFMNGGSFLCFFNSKKSNW